MRWRRNERKAKPDTTEDWVPDDWNEAKEKVFLENLARAAKRDAPPIWDQKVERRTR